MNTEFSKEYIKSGDDRLILTQEIGRRVSMIELAQINVRLANQYDTRPHLTKGLLDIEDQLKKHYSRPDYSQLQTHIVKQEAVLTTYDAEIKKLDPEIRTETTPATNVDQARIDVAQYAAKGIVDIEEYLAGQMLENV